MWLQKAEFSLAATLPGHVLRLARVPWSMPGAGDISERCTVQKGTACPRLGLPPSPPPQRPAYVPSVLMCKHTRTHVHSQCQKQCTLTRASLTQRAPSWELGSCCPWAGPSVPPTTPRSPEASSRPPFPAGQLSFHIDFHRGLPWGQCPWKALSDRVGRGRGGRPESQGGPSLGATSSPLRCRPPALASWLVHLLPVLRVQTAQWPRGGQRWPRRVSLVP